MTLLEELREAEHYYSTAKDPNLRQQSDLCRRAAEELVKITADRDMWLADDVKQNNAVGRLVAEKERRLKEEVGVPIALYRAVIKRMIKQRNSSTDLGLIRQLEELDPDFAGEPNE
jgi:hypothetical protein